MLPQAWNMYVYDMHISYLHRSQGLICKGLYEMVYGNWYITHMYKMQIIASATTASSCPKLDCENMVNTTHK